MWRRYFADPLRGKASLSVVFWFWGCGASVVYTIAGVLLQPSAPSAITLYTLVGLALGLLQSAMLWQCAFNSRFRALGVLLRAGVVVGLLTVPLMLYLMVKYPELLVP